jgi:hypothetical protein
MIKQLKNKIAYRIVLNKIKDIDVKPHTFKKFFTNSYNFLILMPSDETDFRHSIPVIDYLERNEKQFEIVTFDYRVNMLPIKVKSRVVEHGIKEFTKLELPSKQFLSKFEGKRFNAVLDLNRDENVFYLNILTVVDTPIRIGFTKKNSDKFYNFQIVNDQADSEISYKNFLNCLEMF